MSKLCIWQNHLKQTSFTGEVYRMHYYAFTLYFYTTNADKEDSVTQSPSHGSDCSSSEFSVLECVLLPIVMWIAGFIVALFLRITCDAFIPENASDQCIYFLIYSLSLFVIGLVAFERNRIQEGRKEEFTCMGVFIWFLCSIIFGIGSWYTMPWFVDWI